MANSVEEALNRASDEQRERAMATIDEARRNIQMTNMQSGDISSVDASNVARNAQIIEEAKRTIPFETMKDTNTISPTMNTPRMDGYINTEPIELNPEFKADIESVQRSGGNNYLNENAVDRALARESKSQEQTAERQQDLTR